MPRLRRCGSVTVSVDMPSGDSFEFSDEVKRRLGDYSAIVCRDGVTVKSDPFDQTHVYCGRPGSRVMAKPLPNSRKPGYSTVYRNVASFDKVVSTWHPKIGTLYDGFEASVQRFPKRNCLGQRYFRPETKSWSEYKFETYEEVALRRTHFASGLVNVVNKHAGWLPNDGYIVSMYGPNSVNWVVSDLACICQALPSVSLYDTLGPQTTEYILNVTESPVVISSVQNVPKLLKLKPKLPHVKVIITFESLTSEYDFEGPGQSKGELLGKWADECQVGLYSFNEVAENGSQNPQPHNPPERKDTYAINFTSGTTGNPKGVIISHYNAIAGTCMLKSSIDYSPEYNDVVYSCLPLAHISERMNMCAALSSGIAQGYPHGQITEIFDDIKVLEPTLTPLVPRILNRFATSLKAMTLEAPGITGVISRNAYAAKLNRLRQTGDPHHPIWDSLWSNRIRKAVGYSKVKTIGTGSAPLSKDTHEFLKALLSLEVVQGYGLTETMGGICVSQKLDPTTGTCGPVAVSAEVRLRDVPEMDYSADDKPHPRGEVMIRGPHVFRGYYKENQKTLDCLDEDGWFHTGDIGMVDSLGNIIIIDRLKNFFKLAQGEYIGPEKIENIYQSRSTLLNQIFIHGSSDQSYLVAVVGINPDTYVSLVSEILGKQLKPDDLSSIEQTLQSKEIRREFLTRLNNAIEPGALQGFERVKNIHLAIEPLSTANETITQTLKIKRNVATNVFKPQIDAMYTEGQLLGTSSSKAKL